VRLRRDAETFRLINSLNQQKRRNMQQRLLYSGSPAVLVTRPEIDTRCDAKEQAVQSPFSKSTMTFNRRAFAAVAAAVLLSFPGAVLADAGKLTAGPDADIAELMKPGDLPDFALGSADAKVTIVEYASLTCPHCAAFHKDVWPGLKSKYVDTGKVRFIFRDFPLNPRAFGGSMLARCLGGDKGMALVDTLFTKQADWAAVEANPQQALFDVSKQAGFTQESFEKCLTDQKLFEQLTAMQKRAAEVHKVASTPTFFVNGKRMVGPTLEEFQTVIDPMLGTATAPAPAAASADKPADKPEEKK
jgi:protein-disulfide isomerase